MFRQIQRILLIVAVIGFASVAQAHGHGHGGHGHGGHGHGGHGYGGHGYGHYGGHSHFGGHSHWGFGGLHYHGGHYHGWPSYYYYRPYYVYPYGYYGSDGYYSNVERRREYIVSRPVIDVAKVEVRLPESQGKIWVQGKQMSATGAVRRFNSPTLDPSKKYVYTIKAEWYENGRLMSDERKVDVQANSLAVVDFNQQTENVRISSAAPSGDIPPPRRPATE